MFVQLILVKSRLQNKLCDTVYSVYRTEADDKSSFVTNTIPPVENPKQEKKHPLVHSHFRPVCFLLPLFVNVLECEHRPPGRQPTANCDRFAWKYREFSPTTVKSRPRKIVRGRFKAFVMRTEADKKVL